MPRALASASIFTFVASFTKYEQTLWGGEVTTATRLINGCAESTRRNGEPNFEFTSVKRTTLERSGIKFLVYPSVIKRKGWPIHHPPEHFLPTAKSSLALRRVGTLFQHHAATDPSATSCIRMHHPPGRTLISRYSGMF